MFKFYRCDHDGRFYKTQRFDIKDELYQDFLDIISAHEGNEVAKTNPTVTIMIGLPRSGKDTYIADNYNGETIISRDDVMMELYSKGDSYTSTFKKISKEEHKKVDQETQKRFQVAVKNKENIIINLTNLSKKTRAKWLPQNYYKKAVVVLTSPKTCLSRNTTEKYIPTDVLHDMIKRYHAPNLEEFDEIHHEI